jgi:hypothetical protein
LEFIPAFKDSKNENVIWNEGFRGYLHCSFPFAQSFVMPHLAQDFAGCLVPK